MVRARSLNFRRTIRLALVAALVGPAPRTDRVEASPPLPRETAQDAVPSSKEAAGSGPAKAPVIPLERRPYRIRAWVETTASSRIDDEGRGRIFDDWSHLVQRFVGSPWELEIQPDPGPLAGKLPRDMTADDLTGASQDADKLWMIRLDDNGRGGFAIQGRALDRVTGQFSPIHEIQAPYPQDIARILLRLSLALFTPSAEIGAETTGGVRVTIQGGALEARDPIGRVVTEGSLFVPVRIFLKPDGTVNQVAPVGWTYLRVRELEGAEARCTITSSLRNPLSRRVIGRYRLVAVGVKAAMAPTSFRFETLPPESRPAAGYTVTWRPDGDSAYRMLGTTDREGRIVLPPGLFDGLIQLRLLGGGVEPLVEIPVLPGETTAERLVRVNPLREAVAIQVRLDALRDEVVDLVATRARLTSLLESRVQGEAWDEVKSLLDEYDKLPRKQIFLDRLAQIRKGAEARQQEAKVPVLTRTVQGRLADTEALIERYLDDEIFTAYRKVYQDSQQPAPATKKKAG